MFVLILWAFGALLFHCLSGHLLFSVDKDNKIISAVVMKQLFAWDDYKLKSIVYGSVTDFFAQDLLFHILCPDPKKRLSSMNIILSHPFFKDNLVSKRSQAVIEARRTEYSRWKATLREKM